MTPCSEMMSAHDLVVFVVCEFQADPREPSDRSATPQSRSELAGVAGRQAGRLGTQVWC